MSNILNVVFNNGIKCPIIGLGTWKSKANEVTEAVKDAIDIGYRHIDCAYVYGNEKEVGDGIDQKIREGVIKREDIFVVSKLWNTFHRANLVEAGLKESLSNLKLDYLDLFLMHWPMAYKEESGLFPKDEEDKFISSDVPYTETWKAMENLVNKGLVKSIGLSNFNSVQVENVLKIATIKPVVNQVECHPYLNQKKLQEFCNSRGILLTAYSPLGSIDRPWAKPDDPVLLQDPKILEIAQKYNKTSAQVILRYQVQRGNIVIPKSVTKSRIESNIQIFDFNLSDSDIESIESLNCGGRFCHLGWVNYHKEYPFHIEY